MEGKVKKVRTAQVPNGSSIFSRSLWLVFTDAFKPTCPRICGCGEHPGTSVLAPLKSTSEEQGNQKTCSVELVTESWFGCRAPRSNKHKQHFAFIHVSNAAHHVLPH